MRIGSDDPDPPRRPSPVGPAFEEGSCSVTHASPPHRSLARSRSICTHLAASHDLWRRSRAYRARFAPSSRSGTFCLSRAAPRAPRRRRWDHARCTSTMRSKIHRITGTAMLFPSARYRWVSDMPLDHSGGRFSAFSANAYRKAHALCASCHIGERRRNDLACAVSSGSVGKGTPSSEAHCSKDSRRYGEHPACHATRSPCTNPSVHLSSPTCERF